MNLIKIPNNLKSPLKNIGYDFNDGDFLENISKWLRDKHNIFIEPLIGGQPDNEFFSFMIILTIDGKRVDLIKYDEKLNIKYQGEMGKMGLFYSKKFKTYEQAQLQAIKEIIKFLNTENHESHR